jgi:hypothetical protein
MPDAVRHITLHVQPGALPAVRATFEDSLTELQAQLTRLNQSGFVPEPWLGDPISANIQAHYNTTVMESPDGSLAALLAYQAELTRIRDSLKAMEEQYVGGEGAIAQGFGPLA